MKSLVSGATSALLIAAASLSACSDQSKGEVNCVWSAFGASCTVQRTAGDTPMHLCWTVDLACANGAAAQASACANAPPAVGGKSARNIAWSEFRQLVGCDTVQSSSVSNLKLIKGLQ